MLFSSSYSRASELGKDQIKSMKTMTAQSGLVIKSITVQNYLVKNLEEAKISASSMRDARESMLG